MTPLGWTSGAAGSSGAEGMNTPATGGGYDTISEVGDALRASW
jgi:hypothetical protein